MVARIHEKGWTLEIEIPFKALRMPNRQDQVWGIDFRRTIVRKNEESVWSNHRRDFEFVEVSRAGDLVGLSSLSAEPKLTVKPYVNAGASRSASSEATGIDHLFNAGLEDVEYRITPSLTLDLTANPDFAQVEVDDQVANLSRFSIFFPEKREFFLENANVFDFGPGGSLRPDQVPEIKFFHSRTFNFRLNYIYRPGDDLFLVFNETRQAGDRDWAFILKLTRSFDF